MKDNKITISELKDYLEVFTIRQLYDLVHQKKIPFENTGTRILFDKEEIDHWNEERLRKLNEEKDYYTLQEVCEITGLKKNSVYQYTKLDLIPHYHSGKYLRFKKTEIKKWIENRTK